MKLTHGNVAVVTGAGSGIGRALAQLLAQRGCALALADVDQVHLTETAEMVRKSREIHVTTHVVDVADAQAVDRFAAEVVEQHGEVQLLINNAGVALGGTVAEVTLADFSWLMGINFWGVVYGVKAFLPILQRQSSAHIVNISSLFGLIAPPGQAPYAASKFAVRGFTESLRAELLATPIHVSCVHPGGIKTNIAKNARFSGAPDLARQEAGEKLFERLLRMPPEQAAATIIRGIERNQARILIGNDARMVDLLARLVPSRIGNILARRSKEAP